MRLRDQTAIDFKCAIAQPPIEICIQRPIAQVEWLANLVWAREGCQLRQPIPDFRTHAKVLVADEHCRLGF